MPLDLKDSPETSKESRRFSISLSPAGLAGLIGLLLVGLVWVFIVGVLVGRGYKPEQAVPELARIMPGAEGGANATAQGDAPGKGVLRAEDLQFYDDLSKKPSAAKTAPAPQTAAKTAPAPKASPVPTATPTSKPAPAATPAPRPAADDAGADGERTVYDYRYQVASVRDEASARAFQTRLSGLGLDSSLERAEVGGQTWLRVLVHFTGRPVQTRDLKAKLATLGVDKPIMRDKKASEEQAP